MAINVSQTYSQAARLNEYATQLKSIRSKLINDRNLLNMYWQSTELKYINQAIGDIDKKLIQVASMLEGLNSSIRSAAQAIHKEEEAARIAAERAARERAARERAARESAAREAAAREATAKEVAAREEAAKQTAKEEKAKEKISTTAKSTVTKNTNKAESQSIFDKIFGNFFR